MKDFPPTNAGAGMAAGPDGAFERFLTAAIATIITIMFSWRMLVENENGDERQAYNTLRQQIISTGSAAGSARNNNTDSSDSRGDNVRQNAGVNAENTGTALGHDNIPDSLKRKQMLLSNICASYTPPTEYSGTPVECEGDDTELNISGDTGTPEKSSGDRKNSSESDSDPPIATWGDYDWEEDAYSSVHTRRTARDFMNTSRTKSESSSSDQSYTAVSDSDSAEGVPQSMDILEDLYVNREYRSIVDNDGYTNMMAEDDDESASDSDSSDDEGDFEPPIIVSELGEFSSSLEPIMEEDSDDELDENDDDSNKTGQNDDDESFAKESDYSSGKENVINCANVKCENEMNSVCAEKKVDRYSVNEQEINDIKEKIERISDQINEHEDSVSQQADDSKTCVLNNNNTDNKDNIEDEHATSLSCEINEQVVSTENINVLSDATYNDPSTFQVKTPGVMNEPCTTADHRIATDHVALFTPCQTQVDDNVHSQVTDSHLSDSDYKSDHKENNIPQLNFDISKRLSDNDDSLPASPVRTCAVDDAYEGYISDESCSSASVVTVVSCGVDDDINQSNKISDIADDIARADTKGDLTPPGSVCDDNNGLSDSEEILDEDEGTIAKSDSVIHIPQLVSNEQSQDTGALGDSGDGVSLDVLELDNPVLSNNKSIVMTNPHEVSGTDFTYCDFVKDIEACSEEMLSSEQTNVVSSSNVAEINDRMYSVTDSNVLNSEKDEININDVVSELDSIVAEQECTDDVIDGYNKNEADKQIHSTDDVTDDYKKDNYDVIERQHQINSDGDNECHDFGGTIYITQNRLAEEPIYTSSESEDSEGPREYNPYDDDFAEFQCNEDDDMGDDSFFMLIGDDSHIKKLDTVTNLNVIGLSPSTDGYEMRQGEDGKSVVFTKTQEVYTDHHVRFYTRDREYTQDELINPIETSDDIQRDSEQPTQWDVPQNDAVLVNGTGSESQIESSLNEDDRGSSNGHIYSIIEEDEDCSDFANSSTEVKELHAVITPEVESKVSSFAPEVCSSTSSVSMEVQNSLASQVTENGDLGKDINHNSSDIPRERFDIVDTNIKSPKSPAIDFKEYLLDEHLRTPESVLTNHSKESDSMDLGQSKLQIRNNDLKSSEDSLSADISKSSESLNEVLHIDEEQDSGIHCSITSPTDANKSSSLTDFSATESSLTESGESQVDEEPVNLIKNRNICAVDSVLEDTTITITAHSEKNISENTERQRKETVIDFVCGHDNASDVSSATLPMCSEKPISNTNTYTESIHQADEVFCHNNNSSQDQLIKESNNGGSLESKNDVSTMAALETALAPCIEQYTKNVDVTEHSAKSEIKPTRETKSVSDISSTLPQFGWVVRESTVRPSIVTSPKGVKAKINKYHSNRPQQKYASVLTQPVTIVSQPCLSQTPDTKPIPASRQKILASRQRFLSADNLTNTDSWSPKFDRFKTTTSSMPRQRRYTPRRENSLSSKQRILSYERVDHITSLYGSRTPSETSFEKPEISHLHKDCIFSQHKHDEIVSITESIEHLRLQEQLLRYGSVSSLMETDLDTGETIETRILTDFDIEFQHEPLQRTASMSDIGHKVHERKPNKRFADRNVPKSKSLMTLETDIDDACAMPGEGNLQRVPSVHELRVARSLSKLNVPDWYKKSSVSRSGSTYSLFERRDSTSTLNSIGYTPSVMSSPCPSLSPTNAAVVIKTRVTPSASRLLRAPKLPITPEKSPIAHTPFQLPSAKLRQKDKGREPMPVPVVPFSKLRLMFETKSSDDPSSKSSTTVKKTPSTKSTEKPSSLKPVPAEVISSEASSPRSPSSAEPKKVSFEDYIPSVTVQTAESEPHNGVYIEDDTVINGKVKHTENEVTKHKPPVPEKPKKDKGSTKNDSTEQPTTPTKKGFFSHGLRMPRIGKQKSSPVKTEPSSAEIEEEPPKRQPPAVAKKPNKSCKETTV